MFNSGFSKEKRAAVMAKAWELVGGSGYELHSLETFKDFGKLIGYSDKLVDFLATQRESIPSDELQPMTGWFIVQFYKEVEHHRPMLNRLEETGQLDKFQFVKANG